jgi:hypothetical protein
VAVIRRIPLLAVAAFCAAALNGAAQGPDRIDDDAFRALIETVSEPDGTWQSDPVLSNEGAYQVVGPALMRTVPAGSAYIGVGPEQNFTYIAVVRPAVAFIVDIRRENTLLHLLYKALFELSDTRADFVSRLFSRPRPQGLDTETSAVDLFRAYCEAPGSEVLFDANLREALDLLTRRLGFDLTAADAAHIERAYSVFRDFGTRTTYGSGQGGPNVVDAPLRASDGQCDAIRVRAPFYRGGLSATYADFMTVTDDDGMHWSYLAAEESYQLLRDLHLRNLIVPLTGDFGGAVTLRAVADYLRAREAAVGMFYVSNVEQYLWIGGDQNRNGGAAAFYENVTALPRHPAAVFVRSRSGAVNQFVSPIDETLEAVADGRISRYADILSLVR